jgi:hypothetical protein
VRAIAFKGAQGLAQNWFEEPKRLVPTD